ncbi:unnamed protein product [Linum trigynum]|uniref:Uncharacterized protein n=1 Tax=Linum trigynum TaxID=586398 RepID=A0AAV2FKH8_9ROSI
MGGFVSIGGAMTINDGDVQGKAAATATVFSSTIVGSFDAAAAALSGATQAIFPDSGKDEVTLFLLTSSSFDFKSFVSS